METDGVATDDGSSANALQSSRRDDSGSGADIKHERGLLKVQKRNQIARWSGEIERFSY
jgi:hypothetical protein